jgi:proline iminopeptidase
MLHGGPGLSDYLEGLGDFLWDALGEDWTLVRYQQRGLAPSSLDGPFTIEQAVADVFTVCDAVHGAGTWLLGHSWGGHLAMHAAVAGPDQFRGLVIMDTLGAVPDGGTGAMFEHFASRLTSEEAAEWLRIEALSGSDGLAAELQVAQLSILWRYYFSDPTAAPAMPSISVGGGHRLSKAIEEHFEEQTLVTGLPRVRTPTLFLASAYGPIPPSESERSAALMPKAEVVILPLGHFAWLESAATTVEPIANFLSRA